MKTLIENLTSDLLPNQIFQTGFSFLIILKGNSLLKLDSNVLIFIMSGTMKVSSAQQELATVRERHIFFWDKEDDYTCEMLSDSQVILFAFGDLIVHDLLTFRPFGAISDSSVSKDVGLKFAEPLNSFLQLLAQYMEMNLYDLSLYIAKQRELFYILNSVYNEQELAILFSSLTEQSSRFKEQILENYLSAKNVGELAMASLIFGQSLKNSSECRSTVGFSIGNHNISFTVLPYMVMSLARLSMTSDFHLLHTLINFAGHNMD